jgi:hypothetical protein
MKPQKLPWLTQTAFVGMWLKTVNKKTASLGKSIGPAVINKLTLTVKNYNKKKGIKVIPNSVVRLYNIKITYFLNIEKCFLDSCAYRT